MQLIGILGICLIIGTSGKVVSNEVSHTNAEIALTAGSYNEATLSFDDCDIYLWVTGDTQVQCEVTNKSTNFNYSEISSCLVENMWRLGESGYSGEGTWNISNYGITTIDLNQSGSTFFNVTRNGVTKTAYLCPGY